MEPPDDGCVGSFVEAKLASIDLNISSTSKGTGRRNNFKGKNPQNQKERKDVVTKDIRNFSGGSTIVKLSGPLNSKEKKIIKIDGRKLFFFISDWLHCLGQFYRGSVKFL